MKKENIKTGMKVVPFQKTVYCPLKDSTVWAEAKRNNQLYLYVIEWSKIEECWLLNTDANIDDGDYFHSEDFNTYYEDNELSELIDENDLDEEEKTPAYRKLIKVIANQDGFMEGTGRKFCTKRKEYPVISEDHENRNMFMINSDYITSHYFEYDDSRWFDLVYEGDIPKKVKPVQIVKTYYYLKTYTKVIEVTPDGEQQKTITTPARKETIILNDRAIIVILNDGSKGVARCEPDDNYKETKGTKIAYLRAKIKSLIKELKELTKELKELIK